MQENFFKKSLLHIDEKEETLSETNFKIMRSDQYNEHQYKYNPSQWQNGREKRDILLQNILVRTQDIKKKISFFA